MRGTLFLYVFREETHHMKAQQFIDGAWVDATSGRTVDVKNPATEETITTVPYGGREDCEKAIEAAKKAFLAWSRKTPYERGTILRILATSTTGVASAQAELTTGAPNAGVTVPLETAH